MNRSFVLMSCIAATSLGAQQIPSAPQPDQPSHPTQQEADTATPHQSARSFEGRIARSGDQFVLEDKAAQMSYKLDDQAKAKHYLGKNVKVMATLDSKSHLLHVIDIVTSAPEDM